MLFFMCLTGFGSHLKYSWRVVSGHFSTVEYVIRCVQSICRAVLWEEIQDYGLVSLSC